MDSFVQRVQNIAISDRFYLRRKLGSGTFGEVYLGRSICLSPPEYLGIHEILHFQQVMTPKPAMKSP